MDRKKRKKKFIIITKEDSDFNRGLLAGLMVPHRKRRILVSAFQRGAYRSTVDRRGRNKSNRRAARGKRYN